MIQLLSEVSLSVQQLLLTGIGSVTGGLIYLAHIIHKDCAKCKHERETMHRENTQLWLLIAQFSSKPMDEIRKEGEQLYKKWELEKKS